MNERRGHPVLLSVVAVGGMSLLLAGAELSARWWAPGPVERARGFHVFSDTYGWRPRRGTSREVDGKRVSFNSRAFRGPEWATSPEGRTRVVLLGDSIAFGLHVSDDETFAHLLDSRDNGLEALNLAVQGYGPGQELLVLEREGLALRPDVVVLSFCLANDFADAVLAYSVYDGRTPKPRFRLVGGELQLDDSSLRRSRLQRAAQLIADESYLFMLLTTGGGPPHAVAGRHWRERYEEALRDEEYALQLSLAIVRRMEERCRQLDVAFLVAVFPDRASYGAKAPIADRFLARLEAEGVAVVDMAIPFRAVGSRIRSVALDGTGHLSPRGHALAADVLEQRILGLVDP